MKLSKLEYECWIVQITATLPEHNDYVDELGRELGAIESAVLSGAKIRMSLYASVDPANLSAAAKDISRWGCGVVSEVALVRRVSFDEALSGDRNLLIYDQSTGCQQALWQAVHGFAAQAAVFERYPDGEIEYQCADEDCFCALDYCPESKTAWVICGECEIPITDRVSYAHRTQARS